MATDSVPNINIFTDDQVMLMTQAVAIVGCIITEDRETYKIALRAFEDEIERRGAQNAAEQMNAIMQMGSIVGKRQGYATFVKDQQFGFLRPDDD